MTGLEWVKNQAELAETDYRLFSLAINAIYSIDVPSRLARKAREYVLARDAFEAQLAKNGIYVD